MRKDNGAKEALIQTASRLFQEQGFSATGLNQIVKESNTAKGSLYFYFPKGKNELAVAAINEASSNTENFMADILHSDESLEIRLHKLVDAFGYALENSEFNQGCPICTITLEAASKNESIRIASDNAYNSWQNLLELHLNANNISDAKDVASSLISLLEGGLILARASKDIRVLNAIKKSVSLLIK